MKVTKRFFKLIISLFLLINLVNCQSYRDSWQQPEKVMDAVGIKAGMTIGEVGAGDGYFTFHMSKRVGDSGKIYANDIDEDGLEKIDNKCTNRGIKNIITIEGELTDPLFPEKNLDVIIMVYVFHDLEKPVEYLRTLKNYLSEKGKIVIVDRDPDKYGADYDHFWKREKAERLIKNAGAKLVSTETFLSRDNIYILNF